MVDKIIVKSGEDKYEIYDVKLRRASEIPIVYGKIKHGSKVGSFKYNVLTKEFETDYKEDSDEDIYWVLQEFGEKQFHEDFQNNEYVFKIR